MNENFILNFRKIIEQNIQIYKNSQSNLCVEDESRNFDHIISTTQKQLIILNPTVLLTRYEPTQTTSPESNIQSTQNEFTCLPQYDNSKMREVGVELCNQVHSQTAGKSILMTTKKEEKEEKKTNIDNCKKRKRRNKALDSIPVPLGSSQEVLSCNLPPLDNVESKICPQPNKELEDNKKSSIRASLRARKAVMSASYYEAVEPSPKKKSRPRRTSSVKSTYENVPKGFLQIDSLPENADVSEVKINFPALPSENGKYKISIDLEKINLSEVFRTIKEIPPKRRRKSNLKNDVKESTPSAKSEIAKYIEGFSSGCENQNFDGSVSASPMSNNNSTSCSITFQEPSSGPQIDDIVIVEPNENARIGNIINMDSSDVIIDEAASQLISDQLNENAGCAEFVPIATELNASAAPAQPETTIDENQIEDFELLDIDNTDYGLYDLIHNAQEIFNQNDADEPTDRSSQSENIDKNINNTPENTTIRQSYVNVSDTNENVRKTQTPAELDVTPVSAVKELTLPEFCENTIQAHSQSNTPLTRYSFISEDILDLSVHKEKSDTILQRDVVMDLTVSSSYPETIEKEKENVTNSSKNLVDLPENTTETLNALNNENVRRISLGEYQKRHANTEKTVPQSMEKNTSKENTTEENRTKENTTEENKEDNTCDKNYVSCENSRILNNSLVEDNFDVQSSTSGQQSHAANQAGPSHSNYAYESPATKDSGIESEDCGNKSAGNNSNVSLRGDSTPIYRSSEEGLQSCYENDDDALSIYINSESPNAFGFPESCETDLENDYAESDASNSENRDEIITPPRQKNRDNSENKATADIQLDRISDGSSDSRKAFKIPKLVQSALKPTDTIHQTSTSNDIQTNFPFPECSTSQTTSPIMSSKFSQNVHNRKDVISEIFGNRPCFQYIAGHCQKPNCKYSHEIINCNILRSRLSHVNNMTLNSCYYYISRNNNLFRLYFSAFCDTFSERRDRKKLIAMIRDCNLYPDPTFYLKSILAGFAKTGMCRVEAVKAIQDHFMCTTIEEIDFMVNIMIDSDVTQFVKFLGSYVIHPQYVFKMEVIDKLAFKCNRMKHFDLIQLLLKIVIFHLPKQNMKDLKSPELVKFLDMLRSTDMMPSEQHGPSSIATNNIRPDTISHEVFSPAESNLSNRTVLPSMPSLTPLPSSISSTLINNFIKKV